MNDTLFFKKIIENISDIMWEVDRNWIFINISVRTENLKFHPHSILGKTPFEFMPPGDAEQLAVQLRDMASNGKNIKDMKIQFITEHNTAIFLIISGIPVTDDNGDLTGYRGIARIAEKKTEQQIFSRVFAPEIINTADNSLLTAKHFINMFENVPQGIAIADHRGFIIHANSVWKKMFGYTDSDLENLHMNDFRSDENKLHDQELYDSLIKNKIRLYRIERFFRKKNNRTFWCDLTVKLVDGHGSRNVCAIGVFVDITYRKIIGNDMNSREEFTRILINESPFGIGVINEEKFIFVNSSLASMFGYRNAPDMVGINISDLMIKKHIHEFKRKSASVISGAGNNGIYEIKAIRKNGTRFILSCKFDLLTIKNNPVLVIFTQDITESKKNESQLKKLQEGLEKLVEERTNEIKKLNRQVFRSQELERQRISRDLHDGVGQTILAAKLAITSSTRAKSDKRKKLLEQGMILMDMASQELREVYSGLFPSILSELGLGAAINWFIRNTLTSTGITVEYINKITGIVPQFISINVYRIIQELFNNILKHAKADFVKIAIEEKPDYIISITDNGIGFNIEETRRKGKGAGLINIKQRVEYIDGKIYMTSKPGSTLIIIIIPREIYEKD